MKKKRKKRKKRGIRESHFWFATAGVLLLVLVVIAIAKNPPIETPDCWVSKTPFAFGCKARIR